MFKIKRLAFIFLSITMLGNAYAADGINARTGVYLGGALGGIVTDYSDYSGDWLVGPLLGLIPIVGYRFNDNLAVEWNYQSIFDEQDDSRGIYGSGDLRLWTTSLSGKLIYPWQNGLSVYGKAGLAYTHLRNYQQIFVGTPPLVDENENRIQPLVGTGVSYNFTQSTALDLDLSHQFQEGDVDGITTFMLGLTYTFE